MRAYTHLRPMVTKTKPMHPALLPSTFRVPGNGSRMEPVPKQIRQKTGSAKAPAEKVMKEIRRAPRRQFSPEDKIRIVLRAVLFTLFLCESDRREQGEFGFA